MARHFIIKVNGKTFEVDVEELGGTSGVTGQAASPAPRPASGRPPAPVPGTTSKAAPAAGPAQNSAATPARGGQGWVTCPMAGKVQKIPVKVGDAVKADSVVAVLEAMKMETSVCAGTAGTVQEIAATEGSVVDSGALLVRVA